MYRAKSRDDLIVGIDEFLEQVFRIDAHFLFVYLSLIVMEIIPGRQGH